GLKEALSLAIALNDDRVCEQQGRTGKAPGKSSVIRRRHVEDTQIFSPLQRTVERVAIEAFGTEERDDSFAICCYRCIRVRRFRMAPSLGPTFMCGLAP